MCFAISIAARLNTGDYPDNPERYAEFSRAAIEIAKHIWPSDVFHCHDWQSALVPVLLRTSYSDDPLVKDIPVVFSIHNMGYHGQFARDVLERVGLPPEHPLQTARDTPCCESRKRPE